MSSNMSIVDASISSLSNALAVGNITAVDLVSKYLLRIAAYDSRNTCLNSVPLINKDVFREAAASDDRRSAGQARGPLDGIPFTVKDSYKVKGMTVASGSLAFRDLVADEDAFTVKALRDAGAMLLGKTNMCPMAYGGMLRGVYGRAESPYNLDYLAAAFGSGSSNGSGVSVAASFAAFGMGEETVSSGRSPASNNALVAYTPSRGVISIRGNWPLYPTCDVVVPHTRTVDDLCKILDIITTTDEVTSGDFWRAQPFIDLSARSKSWRKGHLPASNENHLRGKRIAVPSFYVTQHEDGPYVSPAIRSIWAQAQEDLESAGAQVEIVEDFPVISAYEQTSLSTGPHNPVQQPRLPHDWNSMERGKLIAYAWEEFLQTNGDPVISSLDHVKPSDIFPQMPRDDPQVKFTEPSNAVHWFQLASYVHDRLPSTNPDRSATLDVPQLEEIIHTLEAMRVVYFEKWMTDHEYDFVAFPAAGDVARADSDVVEQSAKHAWTNGVKYSHGNRVFRHLGIPSVTVPMGILQPSAMPMGLTFLGQAYRDADIINAAFTYEQRTSRRIPPPLTPALGTDIIPVQSRLAGVRPQLTVDECSVATPGQTTEALVTVKGIMCVSQIDDEDGRDLTNLTIYVDGKKVPEEKMEMSKWSTLSPSQTYLRFAYQGPVERPPTLEPRDQVRGKVARDSVMIIVIAENGQGRSTGHVDLIHASEFK